MAIPCVASASWRSTWCQLFGPRLIVLFGNGLILGYLMYRSGLLPRRMAWLGMIGGRLLLFGNFGVLFDWWEKTGPMSLLTVLRFPDRREPLKAHAGLERPCKWAVPVVRVGTGVFTGRARSSRCRVKPMTVWLHESWYHGIVMPPTTGGVNMTTKALTLRLPVDQAEALEAIAGVDEVSINEEIRRAVAAHIETRRQDVEFRERLRASIERNREILERLAS
jgi:hypothetical protein